MNSSAAVPIVTTPARTHLVRPETIVRRRGLTTAFTACGRYLAQLTQREDATTHFSTHEAGELSASITCRTCRKVLGLSTTPAPPDDAETLRAALAALVEAVGRGDEVGLPEAYRAALDALRGD